MPPKRKVKQAARATLAKAARHSRESAVLGVPPPPTSVHFEDAEELQEILAEVTARPAARMQGHLLRLWSWPMVIRLRLLGSNRSTLTWPTLNGFYWRCMVCCSPP